MAEKYSIKNPHPDHRPNVIRSAPIGRTPIKPQRPVYGTDLFCSCGLKPDRQNWMGGRVSNAAPGSAEGKADALSAYLRHLRQCGIDTEGEASA